MDRYLDRLEKGIGNTPSGKIIFNRYFSIKDLYWAILYTTAFGLLAGIGNSFADFSLGLGIALYAFAQGFLNNTYLSLFVNIVYAKIINLIKKSKYFRFYGNLICAFVQLLFLAWHYFIGTQNPIATISLQAVLAFILTNYQINSLKNSKI